jgi:hypothetical protein
MTEKTVGLIITVSINNNQVGEWKKAIGIEQIDIELNYWIYYLVQGNEEKDKFSMTI